MTAEDQAELDRDAVRAALDSLQAVLTQLADDLADARAGSGDFEGAGREVLQVSAHLAQSLVDWLDAMDLTYGDLDHVLRAIAARVDFARDPAAQGTKVFEFLRRISYAGVPDPDAAPDMEDFSRGLEQLVKDLEARFGQ